METLELLGVALGLATLAGINLYLTVFVSGLAIRFGWVVLAPQYEQLSVLADPVIITVAGVLFFLEFFADKVPWVDSLWDSVHTVIRPIGGAMLAITALGEVNPVYDVVVGLLAGGMALTSHSAKAGTRLLVNASPEPFSNVGVSVAEDAIVLAGLGVVATQPIVALVIAVVAVGLLIWLIPGLFRSARATLWFLWRRIGHLFGGVAGSDESSEPPALPPVVLDSLRAVRGPDVAHEMALPCVNGRGFGRRNAFGWLIVSGGGAVDFVAKSSGRPALHSLPVAERNVSHVAGFVCDRLEFRSADGKRREFIQFDRSRRPDVSRLAKRLRVPDSEPRLVEAMA